MVVRMRGVCVLAVTILVVISPAFAQRSPDGLPRPVGYPETPTAAYGALPPCMDSTTNRAVDCEWYGFAHIDYPSSGEQCLFMTRATLSDSSYIGELEPYQYYSLTPYIFDPSTNTSFCLYGCFKIDSTAATPPAAFAPPPLEDPATPPLADPATPPPVVEPPSVGTPPTLFAPAPPVEDPAIPPPALVAPPTIPPPTDSTTPPGAAVPPTDLPPPAPRGVFILNAAVLVRPVTSVLSLVVSGALLVFNLLVS